MKIYVPNAGHLKVKLNLCVLLGAQRELGESRTPHLLTLDVREALTWQFDDDNTTPHSMCV